MQLNAISLQVSSLIPNKYPPAEPQSLRLLAPQSGQQPFESKSNHNSKNKGILPELSNFGSYPAEPRDYLFDAIARGALPSESSRL